MYLTLAKVSSRDFFYSAFAHANCMSMQKPGFQDETLQSNSAQSLARRHPPCEYGVGDKTIVGLVSGDEIS